MAALYTTQVHTWHRSPPASEYKSESTNGTTGSSNNSASRYFITTDPGLILHHKHSFNEVLASSQLHWAVGLSEAELDAAVTSSVCFGCYHYLKDPPVATSTPGDSLNSTADTSTLPLPSGNDVELVGMARLVTDKATYAYLTDVYVLPAHEKRGLGTWLINCVKEWSGTMPSLRQLTLITGQGQKEAYYAKVLGTKTVEEHYGPDGARMYFKRGPQGR